MYCTPGPESSNLINTENAVPINPENNENIKYRVPISLALDDKNHLSCHSVGCLNVNTDPVSSFRLAISSKVAEDVNSLLCIT
jgi:hypothetical protein